MLVSSECPDCQSSGSPMDPQNPGYNVNLSPLHAYRLSLDAIIWAHIHIGWFQIDPH